MSPTRPPRAAIAQARSTLQSPGFEFREGRCGSPSAIAKADTGSKVRDCRFCELPKKVA
jgi:hypothetical protein